MITDQITFSDEFETIVLSEQKQRTTRVTFKYFDTFMYKNHMFIVDDVQTMTTQESCDKYHREEMFETSEDMFNKLVEIYNKKTELVTRESRVYVISYHMIY
jgi:hypothetical protein